MTGQCHDSVMTVWELCGYIAETIPGQYRESVETVGESEETVWGQFGDISETLLGQGMYST